MTHPADPIVRRTVTVAATQQHAFDVFTAKLGSWWPTEFSIGEADMADFILELRVGGRWYEVGVDGTECETGRVTAFEPPERLVLAWHLNGSMQYDPDPAHASEVEIRFIADTPAQTTVQLEHRGLDRHDGSAAVLGMVESPRGWSYLLGVFAEYATA